MVGSGGGDSEVGFFNGDFGWALVWLEDPDDQACSYSRV